MYTFLTQRICGKGLTNYNHNNYRQVHFHSNPNNSPISPVSSLYSPSHKVFLCLCWFLDSFPSLAWLCLPSSLACGYTNLANFGWSTGSRLPSIGSWFGGLLSTNWSCGSTRGFCSSRLTTSSRGSSLGKS